MSQYIVIEGTINQGFKAYGPFDDDDEAQIWAERYCTDEERNSLVWWTMPVTNPQDVIDHRQLIIDRSLAEANGDPLCPECNMPASQHPALGPTTLNGEKCDMVLGRRGWRQLGVYDG